MKYLYLLLALVLGELLGLMVVAYWLFVLD
jgi:hypothetical protein